MARDRLAAMRAQQGGGYNQTSDSYPPQQTRRPNPYAQQDDRPQHDYEMKSTPTDFNRPPDDMTAFYDEISAIQDKIKEFNDTVSHISTLHQRSLNSIDSDAQKNEAQLENLRAETSAAMNELKRRIAVLVQQPGSGREGQIRREQAGLVNSKFIEAIQNYQSMEKRFRQGYKERIGRQFKIVKPDATEQEINSVVNDSSGGQIFSQALMNSNRYGESRAAMREVESRHQDILRIEKTITELAELFNQMSVLVEQQNDTINNIAEASENVAKDTEAGLGYTDKAVDSARAARKKRWICFFITLIILAIIGIVVGVVVAQNINKVKPASGGGDNNGNKTVARRSILALLESSDMFV